MEQDRKVPWRFRLGLLGLGLATFVLQLLVRGRPELVERLYARGLYPFVREFVGTLTGWTSYSIVEILGIVVLLSVLFGVVHSLRAVTRKRRSLRNVSAHWVSRVLAGAGLLYAVGMFAWGFNYYRQPFLVTENLDGSSVTTEELRSLCIALSAQANALRLDVEEDHEGVMRTEDGDRAALRRGGIAFDVRALEYASLRDGFVSRPKSLMLPVLPWLNISGVFFPYTGEANVGMRQPVHDRLFAGCHEMAHQLGWAREQEANFVGYAACRRHPDADYRYAAAQGALKYALVALHRMDPDAAAAVRTTLGKGLERDWNATREFWKRYDTVLGDTAMRVNDVYLKSQGQQEGIDSYGLMVGLLVADHRRGRD